MKMILVYYIGVAGIRSEDIPEYIKKVMNRIISNSFEGEIIVIPIQSFDSRVECINPQYITDEDLIKKHTELMKKLHEELEYQIIQIKENKNE